MRRRLWAALTGVAAAAAVLATAEAVAVVVGPGGSPLFAVGSLVIDFAPPGVKELMISLFGTGDKAALLVILALVILAGAILAGLLEDRRPPWGIVVLAVFSAIAVVAVTTRSGASAFYAIPTVIGMIVGVVILRTLQQRLARWAARVSSPAGPGGSKLVTASSIASTAQTSQSDGDRPSEGRSEASTGATVRAGGATGVGGIVEISGPAAPGIQNRSADPKPQAAIERRQFLVFLGATAVASAVVGFGARMMNAGAAAVSAARSALVLPAPATAAPAVPVGAELGITGLSPVITPAANFYRIDTALQIPQLDPDTWKLKIIGMVENEVEISFAELLALPLVENTATLTCVSNEVGGDLIGNALWLGYPIRDLLARAKPTAGADMVLSRSSDGFTAGTPLEVLQDEGRQSLLAVGMNGSPLPVEHGFPVRMVVPGLYGYVSATKWVVEMKVTTFAQDMGYWTPRGWSALGPIKTASRIDTPRSNAGLAAGTIPIAGVAWAQHTGIAKVEVQIDNGPWQQATLADAISADTWRQWVLQWNATAGDHVISVRATDSSGYTQTSDQAPPAPDGSSGYHTIRVTIQ